jgi:murein DD-endopeptidase MepM/ murein hydrolase activator NlpD
VATVKDDGTKDYGLFVTISDGKRQSTLAHLSAASVQNGASISQGDPIGKSGQSGDATGPHLHWTFKALKNGVVQNKDNGYQGAMDVTELTRLWLDQTLHHDATYADTAKAYLAMTFTDAQYLKRTTIS